MKILIADDDHKSRSILRKILTKVGYTVFQASNGVEALENVKENSPDIIISDVMMPIMDGFELCRKIKADERFKRIPFLFHTAIYLDRKDEELAMALGGERFITKPIEIDQLLEIIRQVLEDKGNKSSEKPMPSIKNDKELRALYSATLRRKLDEKMAELEIEHKALKQSEQKFRRLLEWLKEKYFFYTMDKDGAFTYVSSSITRILGYGQDEFSSQYRTFLPDNPLNRLARKRTKQSIRGKLQEPYEVEIFHKDGNVHTLEVRETPVFEGPEVVGVEGVAHDITKERRREQVILTRLKLSEYSANHTLDQLLQKCLDEVERLTNSNISFFHFFEPDQQQVHLQMWSRKTLDDMCTAEAKGMHYSVNQAGVWADCIREGKPVIHNDYESLKAKKGLPKGHAPVIRELVVPVWRDDKIVAVLGVGNKKNEYTNADVEIIEDIADMVWDIVLRRRAEEDKSETEQKLKAIFNHRFQMTGLLDTDGKVLMANDTVGRMVGVDSSELTGKHIWKLPHFFHSRELQLQIEASVKKASRGDPVSIETTHVDLEGNIRNVDFSLTPVKDDWGNIIYIIPEGRDITEKKLSEEKLIESERNYREIYNAGSDAIIIHDAETGKIVDVNQPMLEMFGYNREEALKLEIGDLSSEESPYTQIEAVKKIQRAKKAGPQLFEWFACHKGGTCFWIEVALSITTIGGKGRVLAVLRNITQRKQLDSELRLVKHSIEHSAYPFFWIQKDSRLVYVNEAACQSLGYTDAELCTMHVNDIDPDFSMETWPEFWGKLKSGKTLTFESRHGRKNGEVFPVEITANHLEFEGQEHLFAYVKDISDQIAYETRQKRLERQLQQAQKMEAVGTLAGGIAHDFNNILSSILGYTELAQFGEHDSEKPRHYFDEVLKAINRAKDLVSQILTFSRKQDQELKPLKAGVVVKEALKLLRSSIPVTIEIKSYIDPNCGLILADATRFHQIIMNLCTNAYQAMKQSGGLIKVNLRPFSCEYEIILSGGVLLEQGSYLKLEVADTGHGIPSEYVDRVFEPYFTTKEKGEGTGLGLAIVHGIVEDFNGKLDVISKVGQGTTFLIYLPVIGDINNKETKLDNLPSLTGGNEHILFVDDEKSLVKFNKIMLESIGYRYTGFTKSSDALNAFADSPDDFDLVVTDMTMPYLTGDQLAREMREIRPGIPIILCTGFSDSLLSEQAKGVEFSGYLSKPILKKNMAAKIREVLDGRYSSD